MLWGHLPLRLQIARALHALIPGGPWYVSKPVAVRLNRSFSNQSLTTNYTYSKPNLNIHILGLLNQVLAPVLIAAKP